MPVAEMIVVVGWLAGWWLLWRLPILPRPAQGTGSGPGCSVIIPARNEASSLPTLLESLAGQRVMPGEVIVVDDGSTDGTPELAGGYPWVTLVCGTELPDGWTGKTWACAQGAAQAGGDTLVFLDADVRLAPEGLASVLDEHGRRGGLVSVQPFHRTRRLYEQASALFNTVSVMGIGLASPGRSARADAGFGPCMVCARTDYEALGGHGSVRAEVIEDVALAKRFAERGHPVHALGGGDLVSYRMYPDGPHQLIEGWSKNIATGAGSLRLVRTALVVLWITALLSTVQRGGLALVDPHPSALGWALLAYGAFVAQQRTMLRQLGTFGWLTALAYPATTAVFVAVFVRSVWLTVVRRQVVWRDRSIAVGHGRQRSTLDPGDL